MKLVPWDDCRILLAGIPLRLVSVCPVPQALEAELTAHEPLIKAVTSTGQKLIQGEHYAVEDINIELTQLQTMWYHLQEAAEDRKRKLLDALESQTVSCMRGWPEGGRIRILLFVWNFFVPSFRDTDLVTVFMKLVRI